SGPVLTPPPAFAFANPPYCSVRGRRRRAGGQPGGDRSGAETRQDHGTKGKGATDQEDETAEKGDAQDQGHQDSPQNQRPDGSALPVKRPPQGLTHRPPDGPPATQEGP